MDIEDLTLMLTRGVGSRTIAHLVDTFGGAKAVLSSSLDELVERAGLRPDVAMSILKADHISQAHREMEYCLRHNIHALAATDVDYPELLRMTSDRPHVLFVRGNTQALTGNTIAMVGTRQMSPSGQTVCKRLVEELSLGVKDLCVVSGLAYGIDAACHRAALLYGATTVAVVASVLPSVTPAPHSNLANDILEHGGAIVSELHSNSRQNGSLFIARNRIIAGMCHGTLVVESPASGGSLSTADIADSYGRVVMAVPGRLTDATSFGTNNLIRTGKARLVLTASDIIEDLGWESHSKRVSNDTLKSVALENLTPMERSVYDIIASNTTTSLVELLNRSKLSIGVLSMIVIQLELNGLVRILPAQRYEII